MHAKSISTAILGALIFATGWETGKVMSPYYASTPIVFEDHQPAAGGGEEQLKALSASPLPTGSAQVQAATITNAQGKYVASKNSTLFHDLSCPAAKSIKPENQVWFASVDAARAAGYSPSACTQKLLNVK